MVGEYPRGIQTRSPRPGVRASAASPPPRPPEPVQMALPDDMSVVVAIIRALTDCGQGAAEVEIR